MSQDKLPLYVDLDGTLTHADTLYESIITLLRRNPFILLRLVWWLFRGRLAFKQRVADEVIPDAATLPYNAEFLTYLRNEQQRGRALVLATAADHRVAQAVAQYLGLFTAVLASGEHNLRGLAKRRAIVQHSAGPFAYAGNSRPDLEVWQASAHAIAVNTSPKLIRQLQQQHPSVEIFNGPARGIRSVLQAMRLPQWSKNALLFLPLLAAHNFGARPWLEVGIAFLAFSLCASATYLINDVLDVQADRQHAHKKHRAIARGSVAIPTALVWALTQVGAGLLAGACISWHLCAMLVTYFVATLAYSLKIKTLAIVDVMFLAMLYSWRIFTGGVVAQVTLSNWMLAFSCFFFLSLALVKRCAELEGMVANGRNQVMGRGYRKSDLPTLRPMGMSSGFMSVMVLALYVDSQNGKLLYSSAQWLWGLVPLLLAWIMHIWLKVARHELRGEDPVTFALRDNFSWATLISMAACAIAASGYGLPL